MKEGTPSATARVIAAATVFLAEEGSGLVSLAAAQWSARFLGSSGADRLLLWSVRGRLRRGVWRLVEQAVLPGAIRHWAVRKSWIERVWFEAMAAGFTQLVVVGAGLDTLGVRVAIEHAEMKIIELDHPATQQIKAAALQSTPVILASCRLGEERVSQVLRQLEARGAFDRARPTMIIIEGVLMYLPLATAQAVLIDLALLEVARLRLVLTAMGMDQRERPAFNPEGWVLKPWLRWRGEPFRWGASKHDLRSIVTNTGFDVLACEDVADTEDVVDGLRGEIVVLALRT